MHKSTLLLASTAALALAFAPGCSSGSGDSTPPGPTAAATSTARTPAASPATAATAASTGAAEPASTAIAAGGIPWTKEPDASKAPPKPAEALLKGAATVLSNVTIFRKDGSWFVSLSEPEAVESDKRQQIYFTTKSDLATGKFNSDGWHIGECMTSILPKGGSETLRLQYEGAWAMEITEWKLDKPLDQAKKDEKIGRAKGRIVMMCEYGKDQASVAGTFDAVVSVY